MDRRIVLAGLAAAITAPALAQTSGSPAPDNQVPPLVQPGEPLGQAAWAGSR